MSIFEMLLSIDHKVFQFINSGLSHPFLDQLMPVITDLHRVGMVKYIGPLLIFLWLVRQRRHCIKTIVGVAIAVGLSDAVTYHVFKKNIQRPRPEKVLQNVNLRTHSHSGFSFPSNHSSNNFAGAVVISYFHPAMRGVAFGLAFLVAFSRVYVGVHFPSDIVAGAFLGLFCGWLVLLVIRRYLPQSWTHEPPETGVKF